MTAVCAALDSGPIKRGWGWLLVRPCGRQFSHPMLVWVRVQGSATEGWQVYGEVTSIEIRSTTRHNATPERLSGVMAPPLHGKTFDVHV